MTKKAVYKCCPFTTHIKPISATVTAMGHYQPCTSEDYWKQNPNLKSLEAFFHSSVQETDLVRVMYTSLQIH